MEIINFPSENREQENQVLRTHWFSTEMAVRGSLIDMTTLDGFVAFREEKIASLVTYRIQGEQCEILSLNSTLEKQGIGTAFVQKVIETAREHRCRSVRLITTNDNINALRFYQKRGFDMVNLYLDALAVSRRLKPDIPLLGEEGIPLRHEIEFAMKL